MGEGQGWVESWACEEDRKYLSFLTANIFMLSDNWDTGKFRKQSCE